MTKNIWKKLISLCLCGVILMGSGCGRREPAAPQPDKDRASADMKLAASQKLALVLGGEPTTLDPAKVLLPVESTLVNQVFEGLVRVNAQGKIEPGIAKKWQNSEDGKTITFDLRSAKWSNGDKLTAKDFAYAWQRVRDPKTGSPYRYLMEPVVKIQAKTDTILEVQLKNPAPYFVYMTSLPAFMPVQRKAVESAPEFWSKQDATLVTNGPFRLKEWKHSEKIELERNPDYWDQAHVQLTHLSLFLTQDQQKMADLFQQGQIAMAAGVAMPDGPMEAEAITSVGMAETSFLLVNTAKLEETMVRKALALAIEREALTKENLQQPATAFVPPGLLDLATHKDFRLSGGNYLPISSKQAAANLLADSGYPKGKQFPDLELIYNSTPEDNQTAQQLQKMWKANLGISVKLHQLDNQSFGRWVQAGEFDLALVSWIADAPDPWNFLELLTSQSAANYSKWQNQAFDAAMSKALEAKSLKNRQASLHQAEQIVMQELPVIPLFYKRVPYLIRPTVRGIVLSPLGYADFKQAWIAAE